MHAVDRSPSNLIGTCYLCSYRTTLYFFCSKITRSQKYWMLAQKVKVELIKIATDTLTFNIICNYIFAGRKSTVGNVLLGLVMD